MHGQYNVKCRLSWLTLTELRNALWHISNNVKTVYIKLYHFLEVSSSSSDVCCTGRSLFWYAEVFQRHTQHIWSAASVLRRTSAVSYSEQNAARLTAVRLSARNTNLYVSSGTRKCLAQNGNYHRQHINNFPNAVQKRIYEQSGTNRMSNL